MRSLSSRSPGFDGELAAFCRGASAPADLSRSVAGLLAEVASEGDAAVARLAARFDGATFGPERFRVGAAEIDAAWRRLPAAQKRALAAAHAAIDAFNRRSVPKGWAGRNGHGARVGERFDPIRRVGLYIPGGQVPLVSTVLMTATLARIAGCPGIAAFTPAGADGRVADALLAALRLARVREVYRIGGVQAIGAMAYGTATIPAVDKVFGPGNAYVCEAKRQVFGTVGVDALPGPSEVMVIADRRARADFAAADLLAQAEHGSGREKIYLVGIGPGVIGRVAAAIEAQVPRLPRSEKAARVLEDGFLAIEVPTAAEAVRVANAVAPEHLEILVAGPAAARIARGVTTAGAILVGENTPTVLGDFAAGPSHVLPTGRTGRFSGGLCVADFMRRTSLMEYSLPALRRAEPVIAAFAEMEQLAAHGRSASIRTAGEGPVSRVKGGRR